MKVMSMLRYFLPNGGDILLNFTHTMDFFAEWKAADSENNFLYHLFWFLYYNNQFKMHNNFKQTKSKRTGQSPLNLPFQSTGNWPWLEELGSCILSRGHFNPSTILENVLVFVEHALQGLWLVCHDQIYLANDLTFQLQNCHPVSTPNWSLSSYVSH